LVVANLRDASDYARCLAYLEGLGVVDAVEVIAARRGEVTFALSLNAIPDYLASELERDDILTPGMGGNEYLLVRQ
jgi:hypothetical protein